MIKGLLIGLLMLFPSGQYRPAGPVFPTATPTLILRGSSQAGSSGGVSTIAVPLPSGTLAGDLAIIFCDSAFNLSAIGGWTTIVLNNGNTWNAYAASKTLSSGDITTGSATCSAGGSQDMVGAMVTFVGGTSGVRESQDTGPTNTANQHLSTSGAVLSTDTGVYWNSIRNGGLTATIAAGSGSLTSLQTITTTGLAASNSLLVAQLMAGGVQTNTYSFTGAGGIFDGTQVIVHTP